MIGWLQSVTRHYERHPYPHYPLFASVRRHDTYALNLQAIWSRFNGEWLDSSSGKILLAGCGAFAPYPFRLGNPHAAIDAVDLSAGNISRARLHCLLHGCRQPYWRQGSFLQPDLLPGPYHFIDAFGVLHHLEDPLVGFRALAGRLAPGGVLRVMVYGRYARQEAESIRRSAKLLGITDVTGLKRLFGKAPAGSRIHDYLDNSWESRTDSGLADLFLHPCVHTYRMDEFLDLAAESGLMPLQFAHTGAEAAPAAEIERFRELDRRRESLTNIICYLGKRTPEPAALADGSWLRLNPALTSVVLPFSPGAVTPENRLGQRNPTLDRPLKLFLRRFRSPQPVAALNREDKQLAGDLVAAWYLLCSRN